MFVLNLNAQITTRSQFKHYTIDQGHINDIMRDSEGFIWMCTQDGLTKYNGHDWIQYNHTKGDSASISHNYVWCSFEDADGIIWLGTFGGGLNRFDKKTGRFNSIRHDSIKLRSSERAIRQLHTGNLIVGTDYGLYEFDPRIQNYIYDSSFLKNQFEQDYYHTHYLTLVDTTHFIGSGGDGAVLMNIANKAVERLRIKGLNNHHIGSMVKVQENQFLAADQSRVHHLKRSENGTYHFELLHSYFLSSTPDITNLTMVDLTTCLVGAQEGLFLIDLQDKEVHKIPESSDSFQNGLTDRIIYSVCEIEEDLYWIGTKTSIFEVSSAQPTFKSINTKSLCDGAILGMYEDKNGNLWIASRKGLGRIENFNLEENRWIYHCYNLESQPDLRNNYILNIWELDNKLCIGYRRKGFQYFSIGDNDKLVLKDPTSEVQVLTKDYSVSNAATDHLGRFWLGTSGNGIIVHNGDTDSTWHIKSLVSDSIIYGNFIFDMIQFHPDTMSAGNQSGIVNINIHDFGTKIYTSQPENPSSLNANFVMDFKVDDSGRYWVSTDGGLHLWKEDRTFEAYTKIEGLPNDVVYGIEGARDTFWVSTNKGICRLSFNSDGLPEFKTFDTSNGVLNNEHNQFSHFESTDGRLMFGGKKGISLFRSKDIIENDITATPVIEQFSLFNIDTTLFQGQHINYTSKILLQPNENFISFELAGLSFRNSPNNQFRYRLKGLNDRWINLGTRNYLSFNGLTPGEYTLEIQASNDDAVWGETVKSLNIVLLRPVHLRWYAWLSYILILSGLAYAFYRQKLENIKRISEAKEAERIRIRERSARDFHDEAGTILTRLTLLTQYLKGTVQKDKPSNDTIGKLEKNLQLLRNGMRDFIWVLDPNKDSVNSLFLRINEIGQQIFEHSSIDFNCSYDMTPLNDTIQINGNLRRHLTMVSKEAFNNIIKHSNAQKAKIEMEYSNSLLEITISDNGLGISQSQDASGHGISNMKSRMKKIGGQLIIENSQNQGTELKLTLPIHPNGS